MKRRLLLIPFALAAVFLDCFVLPALSANGVRPLFVLSLALAATAETKVQDGMLVAFFGGLLTDLFVNPYAGLSSAAYLIAVCIVYGIRRKHPGGKLTLLLCALLSAAAAETFIFVFSLLIGARFDALRLLRVTLPSIVLEALAVPLLAAALHTKEKGSRFHS